MFTRVVFIALLIVVAADQAAADDGPALFDQLFGERLRDVKRTRDVADDLELAGGVLKAAGELAASEAISCYFHEQVLDLCRRTPAGYGLAVTAMQRTADRFPERARAAREKIRDLLQSGLTRTRGEEKKRLAEQLIEIYDQQGRREIEAGDADAAILTYRKAVSTARIVRSASEALMKARLNQAVERRRVLRQIQGWVEALLEDPKNQEAGRELVMAHLVTLNNPGRALEYAELVDAGLKQRLDLAVRPLEELESGTCVRLGDWYASLAEPERGLTRLDLLERAEAYFARAVKLEKEGGNKVALLKAKAALDKVHRDLEKLRELTGGQGRWHDLTAHFAERVKAGATGSRGTTTFKDGVFTMQGVSQYMSAPANARDVVFSVEVRRLDGWDAKIRVRGGTPAAATVQVGRYSLIQVRHGDKQLVRQEVKENKDDNWIEVQVIALDEHLLVFVNGTRRIRTIVSAPPEPGHLALHNEQSKVEFRNPKFMLPTPKQKRELLAEE